MKRRIACLQMTSTNRMEENIHTVEAMVGTAAADSPFLIATPENTYFMRASEEEAIPVYDMESHPGLRSARALARRHAVALLIGSVMIAARESKYFNRSVLIDKAGEIVAFYDKIHLFDASVGDGPAYRESARVESGASACLAALEETSLGLTVCYDVRFSSLYRDLALKGAELIAVPAAFTVPTGQAHWEILLRARAIETGCFMIAPAQCGTHPGGRRTYGHTLIIGPWGEILAEGGETPGIVTAEIDLAEVAAARRKIPSLRHIRRYEI